MAEKAEDIKYFDKNFDKKKKSDVLREKIANLKNFSSGEITALEEEIKSLSSGERDFVTDLLYALDLKKAELEVQGSRLTRTREEDLNNPDQQQLTEEEKAREKREREVATIYKAFDDIYEEHSKEAKEYNKNLNEALKAINENRAIDAETKKKLEKSPEQIAKTRKRWKAIELAKKTADKEGIYHKENIARIRKERSNCLPHEEQNLINKEEVHVKSLSKTQIVNKQYDGLVADKELYAQNISLGLSKAKRREEKAIFLMEAAAFKEIHGVSHEEVIKGSNNQEMDSGSDQLQPEGDIQHIRFTAANQYKESKEGQNTMIENLRYSHEDQKKLATAGKEAKSPIKDPVKQASTLKPIAPNKGKIGRW